MEFIVNTLVSLGLGSYAGRFIFASIAGFAAQMIIKPSGAYTKEGKLRPFVLFSNKSENSTFTPWWTWSLVPGLAAVLFI